MESLKKVWEDQNNFNKNFFTKAESFEDKSRQTKEFALCVMSEISELLKAIQWKVHRRNNIAYNLPQIKNELTDILKYWISLCLVWNISPEQALEDYWRKSMVCRQRYSEEYVLNLEGSIILCDIDGVLANYCDGFLAWVVENEPGLADKAIKLIGKNVWVGASALEIHEQVWQELKHRFRTSRGKVSLPVYEGAQEFLKGCKEAGYKVVLLTSRPIEQYPNIYGETLEWLVKNGLQYDYVWWAIDKGEKVLSQNIVDRVVYAIDDDPRYVTKYRELGIPCFHVTPTHTIKDAIKEVL